MAKRLNVIVGCEESGVVREAFRALGHNAYSCDLVPARDISAFHIQADIRAVINRTVMRYTTRGGWDAPIPESWDLLIAHPPCTYLCNSGVRWLTTIPEIQKPGVLYGEARRAAMCEAADLFADLLTCGIEKIAIENPVMHKYARAALSAALIKRDATGALFDQSIQPWMFGEEAFKRTCLWLRGLPPLYMTNDLRTHGAGVPQAGTERHKQWSAVHRASPGEHRARDRSVTYRGIAEAMAWQWGGDARG